MKLATWNCCRGAFEKKVPLIDHLQADIAVIQEVAKPIAELPNILWFGDNLKIGMAVQVRAPYTIAPLPQLADIPKYVIPVQVSGPVSFILFAVWTMKNEGLPYIRSLSTAIDRYSHLFGKGTPVVVMGDFNSNAIWDKAHPKHLNHSSMVARLEKFGLVSAYHHRGSHSHGSEQDPTFYLHHNREKPFHIDYCFLPKSWAEKVKGLSVASYEELADASDHRPLLVDMLL